MIAELHCHSKSGRLPYYKNFYDSVITVEEILNKCIELGIGILSITDHDSLSGYRKAKEIIAREKLPIILIPGCEITTKQGHILAYGIETEIPKKLSAKKSIELVHQQGGIAIGAHPYSPFFSLKKKVLKLELDGLESYCAHHSLAAFRKCVKLANKMKIPSIGGSDAHIGSMMGGSRKIFEGEIKNWQEVIKKIVAKEFVVEVTRLDYVKFAKEYIKTNVMIRKMDYNTQNDNLGD